MLLPPTPVCASSHKSKCLLVDVSGICADSVGAEERDHPRGNHTVR